MRPVVEFKRTASWIAIGQALDYLEWVLAHRDDGNDFDAADPQAFVLQASQRRPSIQKRAAGLRSGGEWPTPVSLTDAGAV
jgi:hypothetical protein